MNTMPGAALTCLALLCGGAAAAQDRPDAPAPQEPAVQRTVSEDDNVRIEEVKVRGQTQTITVKSKLRGVAPYEIVPPSGARDPSQPGSQAGQRVWHFLSF